MSHKQKFLLKRAATASPRRSPGLAAGSAQASTASATWTNAESDMLMERVLAPANLRRAYQRVASNKGAPGADGVTVKRSSSHRNSPCPCGGGSCVGAWNLIWRDSLIGSLRGWSGYFKLSQVKRSVEETDGWVRNKLDRKSVV